MIPTSLYACIFAKEFQAQAMLRLRVELREKPFVVMDGEPPLEQVCSRNTKARLLGVEHGMTRVEIETFPSATVLVRSRAEEFAAKSALLECAGTFSPRVEDQSTDHAFCCVVDVAGTEKLFGAPPVLAKQIRERVRALGITPSVAVSSNFYAAVCLARGYPARVTVIQAGKERTVLAPLPLAVLDLTEERARTFSLWGIRTLGMLADLPETSLVARLGQEGKRLRQLARGEMSHLFRPVEPAFSLKEWMERRFHHPGVKHRHHTLVHYGRTAKVSSRIRAARRWRQRNGKMLPAHHVRAHRMCPMHVAPNRRIRVVLEKHMILTVPVNGPVRFVHPVPLRLDNSVLEVFVDDRAAFATRIYPTLNKAMGLHCNAGEPALWPKT